MKMIPSLIPCVFRNTVKNYFYLPARGFCLTSVIKLKTLFSEDEQRKITSFINNASDRKLTATGKLRPLNKIVSVIPELGPLEDVNDLLEKHNMSSEAAVKICRNILRSGTNPTPEPVVGKSVKTYRSRKLSALKKSVNPEVAKFAAVTLNGNCVSCVVLEKQLTNWSTQLVSHWNTVDVSTLSLTDSFIQIFQAFPDVGYYVLQTIPVRGKNYLNQTKLYGGIIAIICAKHNFNHDLNNKIFEMNARDSASHFNFIIGNEIVSSQTMVSSAIFESDASPSDDHVFRKSLKEVTFSKSAKETFSNYDYDARESLCQSLVLGKTFAELMKVQSN